MNIHVLHPQPTDPASLTPMAVINGGGGDAWAVTDRVMAGSSIHLNWAMNDEMRVWYTTQHDQVITRKGKPPKAMLDKFAAPYVAFADGLRKAGCPVAPFIWSNPENCPGLQYQFETTMKARLRDPAKRAKLPAGLRSMDPDQCDQWQPGYFDQCRQFHAVCGAGYDHAWMSIMEPYMEFARFHVISGGGMGGGVPRWKTVDYNGWENMPREGVGSPQCYFTVGGAETRLKTGNDPRWLAFLLMVDCVAAIPGCIPTITDPTFSNTTAWHLGALLSAFRALGVHDCVYWSQFNNVGAGQVAQALAQCEDVTIKPDHKPIGPMDLRAKSLSINGFYIHQDEYLTRLPA